ncbi:MAG: 30S ribosomal protein S17 [Patescibacteria group bacterium]|nr:30S ribosomal protein S17 [Patescibacteria group bacterium]MBU1871049.1 30S ribosomal protein S17 [Patescibacteria group bacterium]
MDNNTNIIKRKFNGIVVSDKMDKTIVVAVSRIKIHPRYKKRYNVSKKYKVHDEKNQYKEGDKVQFIETRPISKDKKWRVIYS